MQDKINMKIQQIKYNKTTNEVIEIGQNLIVSEDCTIIDVPDCISVDDYDKYIKSSNVLPDTVKSAIYDVLLKFNVRNLIQNQVGDTLDQLADLSKRVGMLERLVMRLANAQLNQIPLSEDFQERWNDKTYRKQNGF